MTAQQWVFSLVIKEGQKLYRIDRSHPDCVLKKKEKKTPQRRKLSARTQTGGDTRQSLSRGFPLQGMRSRLGEINAYFTALEFLNLLSSVIATNHM